MEKDKNLETEVVENQEEVDTLEEKIVTVEEMQRRIAKEKEKQNEIKKELEDYKANEESRKQEYLDEALERFKKEQEMNADELAEYKKKEAEKKYQAEIDKRDKQIAEYQYKEKMAGIRNVAINKLAEYEIKAVDEVLDLVVVDNPEKTAERIDVLNRLLTDERNKYIGQGVPNTSGGLGEGSKSYENTYDYFRNIKKEN